MMDKMDEKYNPNLKENNGIDVSSFCHFARNRATKTSTKTK